MSFKIIGTGSALPTCLINNAKMSELVDTNDEWIISRTGIRERHFISDESITSLAKTASIKALEQANIKASELSMIICATLGGDFITPSMACVLQKELGANCPSFDINSACSGFIFALDMAAAYLERGTAENILVVAAEEMSRYVDFEDRNTCVLFGDGAGAAVLTKGTGLLSMKLTTVGSAEHLSIPNILGSSPYKMKNSDIKPFIQMNGQEVYKFAVSSICSDIKDVAKKANISVADIDHVLTHQANIRIIDTAKQRLNIEKEKLCINIERTGNTSAASIAILLDEYNRKNRFKDGDLLVLSAFGAGLSSGACIIKW